MNAPPLGSSTRTGRVAGSAARSPSSGVITSASMSWTLHCIESAEPTTRLLPGHIWPRPQDARQGATHGGAAQAC